MTLDGFSGRGEAVAYRVICLGRVEIDLRCLIVKVCPGLIVLNELLLQPLAPILQALDVCDAWLHNVDMDTGVHEILIVRNGVVERSLALLSPLIIDLRGKAKSVVDQSMLWILQSTVQGILKLLKVKDALERQSLIEEWIPGQDVIGRNYGGVQGLLGTLRYTHSFGVVDDIGVLMFIVVSWMGAFIPSEEVFVGFQVEE